MSKDYQDTETENPTNERRNAMNQLVQQQIKHLMKRPTQHKYLNPINFLLKLVSIIVNATKKLRELYPSTGLHTYRHIQGISAMAGPASFFFFFFLAAYIV